MEKLDNRYTGKIENELYQRVMLSLECEYNVEGVINSDNKESKKIIFKDKKAAIKNVANAIREFSENNNLNVNEVKDYLLSFIEERIKTNKDFKEEYQEAKEIILTDDVEER